MRKTLKQGHNVWSLFPTVKANKKPFKHSVWLLTPCLVCECQQQGEYSEQLKIFHHLMLFFLRLLQQEAFSVVFILAWLSFKNPTLRDINPQIWVGHMMRLRLSSLCVVEVMVRQFGLAPHSSLINELHYMITFFPIMSYYIIEVYITYLSKFPTITRS